jgi:hypothetical protein
MLHVSSENSENSADRPDRALWLDLAVLSASQKG